MRRGTAAAVGAVAVLALAPVAPVLAHDGEEHADVVEACGTTLTITEVSNNINFRGDEEGGTFAGSGNATQLITAADGRSATIKSAGQFRTRVTSGSFTEERGSLTARLTGRFLIYPLNEQERREFDRLGLPQLALLTGRTEATFDFSPAGDENLRLTRVPSNVRNACDLLR
jgi:hypothetical protein